MTLFLASKRHRYTYYTRRRLLKTTSFYLSNSAIHRHVDCHVIYNFARNLIGGKIERDRKFVNLQHKKKFMFKTARQPKFVYLYVYLPLRKEKGDFWFSLLHFYGFFSFTIFSSHNCRLLQPLPRRRLILPLPKIPSRHHLFL